MTESIDVLIVEDDRFLSPLLKARFERENLAARQALDGEEALKLLETVRPKVILLDLIMPKISGFELLEIVTKDPQLNRIPIIMLSNLSQDSDIEKAKRMGVVAYYVKVQTSIDDVVKNIKGLIENQSKT